MKTIQTTVTHKIQVDIKGEGDWITVAYCFSKTHTDMVMYDLKSSTFAYRAIPVEDSD